MHWLTRIRYGLSSIGRVINARHGRSGHVLVSRKYRATENPFTILLFNSGSNSGLLINNLGCSFWSWCYWNSDCPRHCWFRLFFWRGSYNCWSHLLFDNWHFRGNNNFHLRRCGDFFGYFSRRGWNCYDRFNLISDHSRNAYSTRCRDIRRRSRGWGNHCQWRHFLPGENIPISIGVNDAQTT